MEIRAVYEKRWPRLAGTVFGATAGSDSATPLWQEPSDAAGAGRAGSTPKDRPRASGADQSGVALSLATVAPKARRGGYDIS